jgi:hypothetical protein
MQPYFGENILRDLLGLGRIPDQHQGRPVDTERQCREDKLER